jgi:protease-4
LYEEYVKVAGVENAEYSGEPSLDEGYENEDCNVAGVNLHGQLFTYIPQGESPEFSDAVPADYISYYIKKALKNPDIKAIVLEIDSAGGSPVAGEEIAHLLKTSDKPTVALIRQLGLSAAYWAATGADIIYASRNSDVGSIGVTYSYLDNVGKNQKEGLNYNQLFSGKYKEMGNPDRTLTEEERNLIIRDLKIVHANFIDDVAKNRNLTLNKVTALADGSSILGEQAKKLGLVDEIGDLVDVETYLTEKLGEKVEICWD